MTDLTLENHVMRSPTSDSSRVENEVVMMNLEKGNYYGLDAIGSYIWEQLAEPMQLSALCADLMRKFAVEPAQCKADVLAFVTELLNEGMVTIVPDSAA